MLSKRLDRGKLRHIARTNGNDSSKSFEMFLNDHQTLKLLPKIINDDEFLLGNFVSRSEEVKNGAR